MQQNDMSFSDCHPNFAANKNHYNMKKKEQKQQVEEITTIAMENNENTEGSEVMENTEGAENTEDSDNTEGSDNTEERRETEGSKDMGNTEEAENSEIHMTQDFRQSEAFSSLSAEEQEAVGKWLDELIAQLTHDNLTPDSLQGVLHAIHYDRDVAQAGIDGEVRGRNTRIEELFEQRRKSANIHVLGGAVAHTSPTPPTNIIGGLSAADRQTIWERGNEKRVILR